MLKHSVPTVKNLLAGLALAHSLFCSTGVAQTSPVASTDTRQLLAFGTDKGGGGVVRVYGTTPETRGILIALLLPYTAAYNGGVRVATGDVNGDGVADLITGPGPGVAAHVKVFDGRSLLAGTSDTILEFFAFPTEFTGGVFVAAGDIDGDGPAEIVVGAESVTPHVKVFDGSNAAVKMSFFAYDAGFTGGVRVAAGDVNGDGLADIVTGAGPGGGPHVKVFNGNAAVQASFMAYDAAFRGGVFVAAGDVNGDGVADIVTGAGAGGPPHVKVFSGAANELASFFAYDAQSKAGVKVGVADPFGHRAITRDAAVNPTGTKLIGLLLPSYLIITTPGTIGRTVRDPIVRFFNGEKGNAEAMYGGLVPFGLKFKKALYVTP